MKQKEPPHFGAKRQKRKFANGLSSFSALFGKWKRLFNMQSIPFAQGLSIPMPGSSIKYLIYLLIIHIAEICKFKPELAKYLLS